MHGGTEQRFAYGYLAGSNLLSSLAMPDGIVRELSYEQRRDLLSGLDCRLGKPGSSPGPRDATLWNARSPAPSGGERSLHAATASATTAETSSPARPWAPPPTVTATTISATARRRRNRPKNSPTRPTNSTSIPALKKTRRRLFAPQYDASGNQTLIRTSTGIWTVAYNAANRAVSFTSRNGNTIIECGYDYQGRRYMKKVTQNGTVASHERCLYRGVFADSRPGHAQQPERAPDTVVGSSGTDTTPPLALAQGASLYCYGTDFNKNVTEVFDAQGAVAATYDYSPYGQAASTGDLVQPVQWSGEMHDEEPALAYYNYRFYNPKDGRWINRDPIAEEGGWNLYAFVGNASVIYVDYLGLEVEDENDISSGFSGLVQCERVFIRKELKAGKVQNKLLNKIGIYDFKIRVILQNKKCVGCCKKERK